MPRELGRLSPACSASPLSLFLLPPGGGRLLHPTPFLRCMSRDPPQAACPPRWAHLSLEAGPFPSPSRQAPFCLRDLLSLSHFPHQLLVPLSLSFFFKSFSLPFSPFQRPLNISACLSDSLSSSFFLRCAPAYRSLRDSLLSLICLCPASVLGQCLNAPLGQLSNSLIPGAFSVLFFSLV